MLYSFSLVFRNLNYILLALLGALIYLSVAILIPSFTIVKLFWHSGTKAIPLAKIAIDFFVANSTNLTIALVLSVSLLSGLNLAMLVFYLKKRISVQKSMSLGFWGMILGLLGIGCASCGSIILTSLLGFTFSANTLGLLPLNGLELGILGVVLLIISIYLLSIKIKNPLVCKINFVQKS